MKKNTKNILKMIIVTLFILVICVIAIPYLINKLLYLPIQTNSTNDSDWLSFWGSFLGGIIGSIGSLGGVLLTLRKMENDKQMEEKKNRPFLVPLEKNFGVKWDIENKRCYFKEPKEDNDDKSSDMIYFDIINLGKEHAFNIEMEHTLPDENSVLTLFKDHLVKNKHSRYLKNDCGKTEVRNDVFQIIKSSESGNIEKTYIMTSMGLMLRTIINNILEQKDNKESIRIDDIPCGILKIKWTNLSGDPISEEYSVKVNIFNAIKGSDYFLAKMRFSQVKNLK